MKKKIAAKKKTAVKKAAPKAKKIAKLKPKKAVKRKPAAKKVLVTKKTTAKKTVAPKKSVKKSVAPKKTVKKTVVVKPKKTVAVKPKKAVKKPSPKIIPKAAAAPSKKVVKPPAKAKSKPVIIAAAPEVKVPKTPKPPTKRYSKTDLEHFKKLIVVKQAEAIENLQTLRDQMLDPSTGEYINENSPYSLHMAEQGTDAMEKEKTYFYAQREQKFLGYLEEALKRIEAGTYGLCVECIDEPKNLCPTCPLIPKERLEAVPHSQLCAQIKKMQEKPRRP
jgi:RNA polymerase-binding transcription factor DksA